MGSEGAGMVQRILVQTESFQSQLWPEVLRGLGRLGQGYLNVQSWMLSRSKEGNWGLRKGVI